MDSGLVQFLKTLPIGTVVDIQLHGHAMMFGLILQGLHYDYAVFTNWPGTPSGSVVRVLLKSIVAVGLTKHSIILCWKII